MNNNIYYLNMKRLMNISIVLCMFTTVFLVMTQAQTNNLPPQTHKLSPEELADFRDNVEIMIKRFQNFLSILGSKDQTKEVKAIYVRQTLLMFMGEGKPYKDAYGNEQRAVRMQTSSLSNPYPTSRPMSEYLNRLIALPYAKVEITSAETFQLGELKPVGDHYEAVATIFQRFCGWYSDQRQRYCDTTAKTLRVYLTPEEDFKGKKWIIKFGDVDVLETTD